MRQGKAKAELGEGGNGTIKPDYNNAWAELSNNYRLFSPWMAIKDTVDVKLDWWTVVWGILVSVLICNIVIIYAVTSGLINQAISEFMRYQGMFQEHFFL